MHHNKLIRKIWGLSRYDFMNNLTNWLVITGVLATGVILVCSLLTFVTHTLQVPLWNLPTTMLGNMINLCFECIRYLWNYNICHRYFEGFSIAITLLFLTIPIIILQNSLDLAFDSTMSGFGINRVYTFFLTQPIFAIANCIILWTLSYSYHLTSFVYLLSKTPQFLQKFGIEFAITILVILTLLYVAQIFYLLGLHLLEYKKRFVESIQDIVGMIKHQQTLLALIILLQLLVVGIATTAIYFCLQPAVQFLVQFVFWPFSLLNIAIAPVFTIIMSNFFYCWAYMMLYAWVCLVTAHLYRQLVCPPSNNPSCLSCTSCEK